MKSSYVRVSLSCIHFYCIINVTLSLIVIFKTNLTNLWFTFEDTQSTVPNQSKLWINWIINIFTLVPYLSQGRLLLLTVDNLDDMSQIFNRSQSKTEKKLTSHVTVNSYYFQGCMKSKISFLPLRCCVRAVTTANKFTNNRFLGFDSAYEMRYWIVFVFVSRLGYTWMII